MPRSTNCWWPARTSSTENTTAVAPASGPVRPGALASASLKASVTPPPLKNAKPSNWETPSSFFHHSSFLVLYLLLPCLLPVAINFSASAWVAMPPLAPSAEQLRPAIALAKSSTRTRSQPASSP
jgi:hypothetical protein